MAITLVNPNSRPVVPGESVSEGVSVAIDYTSYYDRIATALETLATNSTAIKTAVESIATQQTTIATQQTTIATQQTTIATKLTAIETYQQRIKELAEGTGVHFVGPWEWVGLLSLYKLFIEEGKILEETNTVSAEKLAEALAKFNQYKDKVNSLPTVF
jgi:hypothetical protein